MVLLSLDGEMTEDYSAPHSETSEVTSCNLDHGLDGILSAAYYRWRPGGCHSGRDRIISVYRRGGL